MLSAFRHMRSHTRLFLLFITTILVPTSILTFISYRTLYNQVQSQALTSNRREIAQLCEALDERILRIVYIGHLIDTDPDIQQYLLDYQNGVLSLEETNTAIQNNLQKYSFFTHDASNFTPSISIITSNGTLFGDKRIERVLATSEFQDGLLRYQIGDRSRDYQWFSDTEFFQNDMPSHDDLIYLLFDLHASDTWSVHSTLVFAFRESDLLRQYMGSVSTGQSIYILDQNGYTLSKFGTFTFFEQLDEIYTNKLNIDQTAIIPAKSSQLLVTDLKLSSNSWRIVSISSLDTLLRDISQTLSAFLRTMFLFVSLSLLLSFYTSRRFMAPIQKLHNSIRRVSAGDFSTRVEVTSNDEIGELSEQFNHMVSHTQQLMELVVQEQEAKRKADIIALQSQINPHFLYNTLSSIRYMVLIGNHEDADTAILALNRILKCAFSGADSFISINMEIEQLRNYLTIAKFGFSVPLQVQIEVAPEIGDCQTIKLMLQPIVENAVRHGLKGNLKNPTLRICAYQEAGDIVFLIEDNGHGFDVSILSEKNRSVDSSHIGIKNVHARIQLHFGSRYGLSIKSEIGKGTKVWIRIPKISGLQGDTQ